MQATGDDGIDDSIRAAVVLSNCVARTRQFIQFSWLARAVRVELPSPAHYSPATMLTLRLVIHHEPICAASRGGVHA